MCLKMTLLLLAVAVCVGEAPGMAVDAFAAVDKYAHWENEIAAFEKADAVKAPPQHGILFVGSSSIRMWNLKKWFPDLQAINRGFGGSEIEDSTHFAPRIVIKYHPRLVVFYAGDNDINAGKKPEEILADFKDFVKVVQGALPRTRILFLSIKPSLARVGQMETQKQANALVEAYCKTNRQLLYVDVATPMLNIDGKPRPELFGPDGLHMNDTGYALWTEKIRPLLR